MVIIKCNAALPDAQRRTLEINLHDQAADGVIVLPNFCELLNEVPADEEIQVIHQDTRVAELEAELAAAMKYINAQRACSTCKQYDNALTKCDNVCSECKKEDCFCRTCHNGSKWEWRAAHG